MPHASRAISAKRMRGVEGYFYIAPWFIGFAVFGAFPLVASLYYSFTDFAMFNEPALVGFGNYAKMLFDDREVLSSLATTLKYVLLSVPLKLLVALAFALVLNRKTRFTDLFTTVFYLPSILGASVSISILWRFLFKTDGIVNGLIGAVGIKPIPFLEHPRYALFTVSLLVVWSFGSSMVVFLAGLKQIPDELYEATRVDGASSLRSFFAITLPLITPSLFFNMIMQTINAFQYFTGAFVITRGGPVQSTYLYMMKLYDEAFGSFKMGYASALSWLLFAIILGATLIVFRTSDNWVHYQE
jgi:oligogalacturonide transport system permease protein